MAGDGVDIPLESMAELSEALGAIIAEYKNASSRTGQLTDAISRPQGRGSLQSAAEDFEAKWDDKRETQRRHLEEMKKRLDEARENWAEADAELAKSMESAD